MVAARAFTAASIRSARHFKGHGHFRHHGHWRHRHIYYVRARSSTRPARWSTAQRPSISTNRCTCLTKEYTQEGAVLFKDICTNEAAINPPPAPVQTGYAPQPMSAPQVQ